MQQNNILDVCNQLEAVSITKSEKKTTTSKKYLSRPTFYTKKNNPIRAGGVMFVDSKRGWLMQYQREKKNKKKKIYADFGGKTELIDISIHECITRELIEETNEKITSINWENAEFYYDKSSKYLFVVVNVSNDFMPNPEVMGDKEIKTNIPRVVQWVNPELLHPNDLHIRIRWLFSHVKRLNKKIVFDKQ